MTAQTLLAVSGISQAFTAMAWRLCGQSFIIPLRHMAHGLMIFTG